MRRVNLNNRLISISVVSLLITAGFLGFITFESEIVCAGGGIVYVDDDNAGYEDGSLEHPYNTIQEGVNASFPGDTVFVFNGTYYENVVINKAINLTGEDRDITIIDGGGNGNTILVGSFHVNITGFSVTGSGGTPNGGIKLGQVQNCRIFRNNVTNCSIAGIFLHESSNNFIYDNNVFSNDWSGIRLHTEFPENSNLVSNNIISNNTIFSNYQHGILLHYSLNNIVTDNNLSNNPDAIQLEWADHNIITNNILSKSGGGIVLDGSHHNLIIDNTITSIDWDGIVFVGWSNPSNNNIIANNNISSCIRYGILISASSDTHILNNTVYNCSSRREGDYSAICLTSTNYVIAYNNTISNNNVSLNFGHGIEITSLVSNTQITKNIVSHNLKYGIFVKSVHPNNITNNNIWNNSEGIHVSHSYKSTIAGNDVYLNRGQGIATFRSNNTNISGNNIFLNGDNGINLTLSENMDLKNNNIWSNFNGIHLTSSTEINIIDNDFTDDGVLIKGSSLEHFNSHTITDDNIVNGEPLYYYKNSSGLIIDGISLGELILANCTDFVVKNLEINRTDVGIEVACSSKINITNNNVSSNNYGFYLCLTSNNSITSNNIYSNKVFGIHLTTSWNNSIYHNYIINNPIQAYDDRNDNLWNDSYPSGGNYWSDFNEPSEGAFDDFKGQDQNVSGGDGIVDLGLPAGGINPYVIDSDSQDVYPLIDFEGNFLFLFEGWNLISLPFIQADTDLETVLQSIEGAYDTVEWYDIGDGSDHWKVYNTYKPSYLIDLHDLDHKMGFWIHITKPGGVLFEYFGSEPSVNQNIMLYPGWNIVGYPSLTNKNRTTALNNLDFGTDADFIWTWDAAMQKWEKVGGTDYFEVGRGYWLYSNVQKVWNVPL